MASPNLVDVLNISGDRSKKMKKKVIKASDADKVEKLTKEDKEVKPRSASEVRSKLYGKK